MLTVKLYLGNYSGQQYYPPFYILTSHYKLHHSQTQYTIK